MDTPAYARTLLITDAAINIEPELEDKIHIVQNAIDLAHALGIPEPKVALLSAVETVNPKIKSTLDAAALCKMADRGQITGGILDGPLAFDTAVSVKAAKIKGWFRRSPGRPTSWWCPTWRAATCWPSSWNTWAARSWPASCSARAFRHHPHQPGGFGRDAADQLRRGRAAALRD
jgi:phosphotransacetylase